MRYDGDEGLFRAYESVEFLAPLYAGDWIEAKGRIVRVGNSSRTCEFEVWKIGGPRADISESAAEFLDEPVLDVPGGRDDRRDEGPPAVRRTGPTRR